MSKIVFKLCGFILFALVQNASSRSPTAFLQSQRVTDWGDWGHWAYCPGDQFVLGVELLVEGPQGKGDDTGLNGIKLKCRSLTNNQRFDITSKNGPWGGWQGFKYCDGLAVEFQLKSEPKQGDGDDVAGADFKLFCSGQGALTPSHSHYDWGTWTAVQQCPHGTAVCGIQTQVESPQGRRSDDTALNNVDVACCKVPNPAETCRAGHVWKTQRNCNRGSDRSAEFVAGISVNNGVVGDGFFPVQYERERLGFSLKKAHSALAKTFERAYGSHIENRKVSDIVNESLNKPFRALGLS